MSMEGGTLPPWQRRDNFGLQAHQRVVDRLNNLSAVTPAGELEVMGSPSGTGVLDRRTIPTDRVRLVRVTGNEAGGGKYTGVILESPTSDVAAAGDLAAADMGVVGESVRLINGYEVATGTHDLTTSGKSVEAVAVYRRTNINTDGKKVFAIVLVQTEDCAAGSGGAPAATSNNFLLMGA